MRLRDLDARFLRHTGETWDHVDELAEADGVMFQCPLCAVGKPVAIDDDGGGRGVAGAHYVVCWFVGRVPDEVDPKPGRWTPKGTGIDDLTFVPGEPPQSVSVLLTSGCKWHGFVRDGEAA